MKCFNAFTVLDFFLHFFFFFSILAFCHVVLLCQCVYLLYLCFFDCQVDFDVDNISTAPRARKYLRGIVLYKSYYYY